MVKPRSYGLPAVRRTDVVEPAAPPATADLTERQAAYVRARVDGLSGKDSAISAGYSEATAKQAAWRLNQTPAVIRAVHELSILQARVNGGAHLRTLDTIAADKTVRTADRIHAITEMLDRTGYPKTSHVQHTVERKESRGQMLREIVRMAGIDGATVLLARYGFTQQDIAKLGAGEAIDAEFEPVEPRDRQDEFVSPPEALADA